jgi:hypothetical protein
MNKSLQHLFWAICLLALLAGCVSNSVKTGTNTGSNLPDWFYNPHYKGYMGITSSAPVQKMGGIEGQRRVALLKARAELARMQNVQVEARSKTFREVSKQGVKFNYEDYKKLSTAQGLDLYNVSIKDEWIDTNTGELYLWLIYPISSK